MNSLKNYLAISFTIHVALISTLAYVHFTSPDNSNIVYEVTITGSPSRGSISARTDNMVSDMKYIHNRGDLSAKFDEIERERMPEEQVTDNSPPEEESTKQSSQESDFLSDRKYRHDKSRYISQVRDRSQDDGYDVGGSGILVPDQILIWKARITAIISHLWEKPAELSIVDMSLLTTYRLRVNSDGSILEKELILSSGNMPFDRSVLSALNRVIRFPPPPLILISESDTFEIVISFSPPRSTQ